MISYTGQNGRLNLSNSHLEFKNWKLYRKMTGPTEPPVECRGSLEIEGSDYNLIFKPLGSNQEAEFFIDEENEIRGLIAINDNLSPLTDPIMVFFKPASKLKKNSRPDCR